ncbi:MAG: hypothetical protein CBC55_02145 [Gammaproteobacteria bacterium TMED95]|nr:MAG: hypothetical protein CBC55_02145 [Gammaproteobacteria bacterium TMED95]|tara:strand:- start:7418 stop:8044 length:627 start_codon:yes stop_codon:yes gene_type:complete
MSYVYSESERDIRCLDRIKKEAKQLSSTPLLGEEICFTSLRGLVEKEGATTGGRAYFATAYDLPFTDNPVSALRSVREAHAKRLALAEKHQIKAHALFEKFSQRKTRSCSDCNEKVPMNLPKFKRVTQTHFEHFGSVSCPFCRSHMGLFTDAQKRELAKIRSRYDETVKKYVAAYQEGCEKLYKQGHIKLKIIVAKWVHESEYVEEYE